MWSAWMPIQAYGYTGPKPYVTFGPDVVRYGSTWMQPQWRYDPAAGYVEYAGLCSLSVAKAGSFELLINYMNPTPAIPYPADGNTQTYMLTGMTNMGDASYGHPVRYTLGRATSQWPGSHHHVWWTVSTTAPAAGRWFWLNSVHSFSDSDPEWFPWRKVVATNGQTINSVRVDLASRFSTSYSAGWDAEMRCTKDYKRWQWRNLLRNSGGALSGSPYNNIAVVTHPNPQTLGNCLNTALVEYSWAGGNGIPYRIDNRQNAAGHQLDMVSMITTFNPTWAQVELDYFTRT